MAVAPSRLHPRDRELLEGNGPSTFWVNRAGWVGEGGSVGVWKVGGMIVWREEMLVESRGGFGSGCYDEHFHE